jgi:hypothetical protein
VKRVKRVKRVMDAGEAERFQKVDLATLELVRARSTQRATFSVMRQCALEHELAELGLNHSQIAAAVGRIVGRMAYPGSELATHAWRQQRSGLGELMDFDFEAMDLNRLYRASDALCDHREALQDHLFDKAKSLFGFGETVALETTTILTRGEGTPIGFDHPHFDAARLLIASRFPPRVGNFWSGAAASLTTWLPARPGACVHAQQLDFRRKLYGAVSR